MWRKPRHGYIWYPTGSGKFELELIQRDEINITYILKLLAQLQKESKDENKNQEYQQKKDSILKLLDKESQLRKKRGLITKFINTRMPQIEPEEKLEQIFNEFWHQERIKAVKELCQTENLNQEASDR